MALVNLLDINLAFGGPPVLENVNFQIDPGERVCLVGRNGSGKTTLMRVIAGEMPPDSGAVSRQPGTRLARLTQEIPPGISGAAHDIVAAGLVENPREEPWERELRLENLLERMAIDPRADFASLSGGLKRRVLLARALASQPGLLLLDEPTNHLDLESILWLENFLLAARTTLFFVTHDRAFLRKLATRIIELDRAAITNWDCPHDTYLARRQERLEAEERQQAAADKKLAQEEDWARRKPSAQRKRSGARLEALATLRAERLARRERTGIATLRLAGAAPTGVKVIDAQDASFAHPGGPLLIRDLTTTITRGDKIGIIGPNGSGKTTLIKLLLGQLAPATGAITHGTNLEVVYYDQFRAQIDDDKTVADNIADGNTTVTIDGRPRHVITYLQDFLFTSQRARTPARVLSGGERNRLLLARLFTKPANVLVLDEPTNDLDAETLDLLENLLVEYQGTLLLVSHDRDFLDNVVTSTMVFEGEGRVSEYIGGHADYLRQRAATANATPASIRPTPASINTSPASASPSSATGATNPPPNTTGDAPAIATPANPSAANTANTPNTPDAANIASTASTTNATSAPGTAAATLATQDSATSNARNQPANPAALPSPTPPPLPAKPARPRKLTNKETRELETLPARIEALEAGQTELAAKLAAPDFYKRDPAAAPAVRARLSALEEELAAAYARWEELETTRAPAPP